MAEGNRIQPGAGRITVTMSMSESMLLAIDAEARADDVSRSALVRRIIRKHLTNPTEGQR